MEKRTQHHVVLYTLCRIYGLLKSILCCFCSVKSEDKSDIYDFGVILMELILGRTIKSINVDTLKDLVIESVL